MNFCKTWVTISVIALVTLAPCRTAFAHIDTAVIVGRAVDGSGGVLPGVMVSATQDATGVVATSTTSGGLGTSSLTPGARHLATFSIA